MLTAISAEGRKAIRQALAYPPPLKPVIRITGVDFGAVTRNRKLSEAIPTKVPAFRSVPGIPPRRYQDPTGEDLLNALACSRAYSYIRLRSLAYRRELRADTRSCTASAVRDLLELLGATL